MSEGGRSGRRRSDRSRATDSDDGKKWVFQIHGSPAGSSTLELSQSDGFGGNQRAGRLRFKPTKRVERQGSKRIGNTSEPSATVSKTLDGGTDD